MAIRPASVQKASLHYLRSRSCEYCERTAYVRTVQCDERERELERADQCVRQYLSMNGFENPSAGSYASLYHLTLYWILPRVVLFPTMQSTT